jgi:ribosome biogenesis GTPase
MLDRILVVTEKQGIPDLIVANKVDLVGMDEARELFGVYAQIGYPLVYCSALSGQGIDELREHLSTKISVLVGPSGVGKTSLLNRVQTGLGLAVREVSEATSKGRHTTVVRQMFPLDFGGYVADTPGLKALALWDIEPLSWMAISLSCVLWSQNASSTTAPTYTSRDVPCERH